MSSATKVQPLSVPGSNGRLPFTTDLIPAGQLTRYDRVQRELSEAYVDRLVRTMNVNGLGAAIVSRRANGENVVIDGQHRVAAVIVHPDLGERFPLLCIVHEGLSEAMEAELFLTLNASKIVNVIDRFRIGVVAKRKENVAINKIIDDTGFIAAASTSTPNSLRCMEAIFSIYRGGKNAVGAHAEILKSTLEVIALAWGHDRTATRDTVLGVGRLLTTHQHEVDIDRLIEALAAIDTGPIGFRQRTLMLREGHNWTIAQAAESFARTTYNKTKGPRLKEPQ